MGPAGSIPCCMLTALEQQTGKQVRDCFAYVAGTSTGADLCALIQAGVPMTTALTFISVRTRRPCLALRTRCSRGRSELSTGT